MNTQANKNQLKVPGGTTGQALVKSSNTDYDFDWADVVGGGGGGGTKLAIDTTQISTNNQTFTTLYTVPIPGGILGTNNAIRFKVLLGNLQIAANKDLYVKFVYGGSDVTGTLLFDNDSSSGSGEPGVIEGVIVADNATNAQKGYSQILWQENGTHNTPVSYGTGTVDASVSQNLELQVRFSDTGCIIRADTIIVEKINGGNANNVINLTAGEDLTIGDTAGYASFIDDTAMKAVWAYRQSTTTPALITDETIYNAVCGACQVDTNKYVLLVTNNQSGINTPLRAIVATLDVDTNIFSFGTISSQIKRIGVSSPSICKVGTNKFAVAYLDSSVNYELSITVGTVSGTTISLGSEVTYTSSDNGDFIDMIQLDTDRIAVMVSFASVSSVTDLFEVTISGTVPTIPTATSVITPVNNRLGILEKIATDKIAIVYATNLIIATVSGGVWTIGTPVTLPSSLDTTSKYGRVSTISITTDELYVAIWQSNTVRYLYYTISGTVPTLVASGSYADSGNEVTGLSSDNTDIFLLTQSSDATKSGVAKLTVNGASIDISVFTVLFDMSSTYSNSVSNCATVNKNIMRGSNYYGIFASGISLASDRTIYALYHIKGMTNLFTGIVQNTVSRGGTAQVLISGVDENQTGLTTGALYNAFEGGIVSTSTQLFNTMQAQSATKLKI